MPVRKVGNTWRIGSGKARYRTKAAAERAYAAYRAKRHSRRRRKK